MERVWLLVGFQLFFGKQSILADHLLFRLQKIKSRSIKDYASNILTDENEIHKEYFEYLLNPVNRIITH